MAADLRVFLLNCFIGGEARRAQPQGGWVRNETKLSFCGHCIRIIQKPWVISAKPSEYRDQAVDTTTVIVPNVEAEQREEVLELLRGLAWLLSFATCSDVALYGWEHSDSKPRGKESATVACVGYFRPLFNIRDGKAVRVYLERVQREYFRLEETRKLREAIHLFVLAETRSLPLELRLATIFILLENLKSTFAKEQGYPFKNNYYLKEPRELGGKSKERWSFESLLSEMLKKSGMCPDLGAIKDLRNEIIHSGVSQTPCAHQREVYDACQDLVRGYLLRLLGYTGTFRLYSERGMTTKQI